MSDLPTIDEIAALPDNQLPPPEPVLPDLAGKEAPDTQNTGDLKTASATEDTPDPALTQPATPALRGLAELMQEKNLFEEYRRKEAEKDQKLQEYEALTNRMRSPDGLLDIARKIGVRPEDVVAKAAEAQRTADPLDPVKQELARVKAELETFRKQREEENKRQAVEQARQATVAYVHTKKDEFPLVNAFGYEQLVFDTIHTHMQQTGQAISEADAAARVESELKGLLEKAKTVLGQSKSPEAPPVVTPPTSKAPPPVISNQTASQLGSTRNTNVLETQEEALAKAASLLQYSSRV